MFNALFISSLSIEQLPPLLNPIFQYLVQTTNFQCNVAGIKEFTTFNFVMIFVEMVNVKSRIKNYILQNVTVVWNPRNPHKVVSFSNLAKMVDLLFWVIDHEAKDEYLNGIGNSFYTNAEKIIQVSAQNIIFDSTGQLAQTFEKFVKKIGFLRFRDDKFWSGNKTCLGIKESSLLSIYSRTLDKRGSNDPPTEPLKLQVPIVQYFGMRRIFLDIIARDFDITLDSEKKYTKKEIIGYSNFVLGCYLMVVEDNFDFLYRHESPESAYIKRIISGENFKPSLAKYVELFCEKVVYSVPSDNPLNKTDSLKFDSENENGDINILLKDRQEPGSILHTVTEVFQIEKNFILLGDAGSGKSTSLLYLFYKFCLNVEKSVSIRSQFPMFIKAHHYDSTNKFLDIIHAFGQRKWIQEALTEGRVVFFIDGLNEIDENLKSFAYEDLISLMRNFSECRFILSARSEIVPDMFNLPCYRLQAFREFQIYDFLKKNVDKGYEKLYKQITESENLKELANNPLLIGIIASLFNSGTVPDCEGLLFDAFIESLLTRENILEHKINNHFIVEILSQMAFSLKQSKRISCDIEELRSITMKFFDSQSITCELDSFIDGIQRRQLIQISEKQNISFCHESYLDYFAAKEILKTFRLQNEIVIEFSDVNWYKPLIMCGDLSVTENISEDFSEFLFRGGVRNKLQKPLNSFTDSDFNEHLLIACKVAYNLRSVNPEIYRLAQIYVHNTLLLWLKTLHHSKNEAIPLEIIFGAIAALNSERLIRKILTEEKWLFLWVYDQNTEIIPLDNKDSDNPYSKVSKFNLLVGEYTRNTPDFSLTLKILDQQLQSEEIIFFNSMHQNLIAFKNFLLQNVPIRYLIKYYKEEPNYEALWFLLQRDLRFLSDNLESILKSGNVIGKSILLDILKAHSTQAQAYKLVFENIQLVEYDKHKLFEIIEFSIYHNEATEFLISYFDDLIDRDCSIFNNLLFFVRKCSWDALSEKVRSFFKENFKSKTIVKYEVDHFDLTPRKVVLDVNRVHEPIISNSINQFVRFNNNVDYQIIGYTKHHRFKSVDLICSLQKFRFQDQIDAKGILTFMKNGNNYRFQYRLVEMSLKNNTLTFSLDRKTYDTSLDFLEIQQGDTIFCKNIPLTFISRSSQTFLEQPFDLKVELICAGKTITIPQKGEFEIIKTTESITNNFGHLLFHPEQFKDTEFVRDLTRKLRDDSTLRFIESVGISHLFADKIKVRLGIIITLKDNIASVFCFESDSYIDVPLPIGKNLSIEDTVVIEKDGNIFQVAHERDGQLKYEIGYIISVDEMKQSGFIRNVDTTQDCFFSSRNINTHLNTGDKVRFVRIKNKNLQYNGMQIAVKISKIHEEQKICIIVSSHIDSVTNSILGQSKDINSGQLFRFRIRIQDCSNIRNLIGIPITGKYFSYFLSRKSIEKNDYPKIRLIELLGDEN